MVCFSSLELDITTESCSSDSFLYEDSPEDEDLDTADDIL
jgi:hypothetical protein